MDYEKKIVLAIDDNIQQLTEFKHILIPKYDLRIVKSASEGMSFINKTKADIILLDIDMPNITGFEYLEDIKKIPSYVKVPVIIVSSHTEPDFLKKARGSTAADVLTKPVMPETLINAIEKALADSLEKAE